MTLYQLIQSGYDIGLKASDYPLFDEEYRETLNNKILNRYMFNEIGFETPARFIFELNTKMSIIMPYYNDLYNAYEELKSIGFKTLIHESIGSDVTRALGVGQQDNTHTTTGNVTEDEFGQVADTQTDYGKNTTTHYGKKSYNDYGKVSTTDYGKENYYDYGKKTTTEYGHTLTNNQEQDGKSLTLNSDTPQSSIDTSLKNTDNWNKTPFVTDGNLNISNIGETKTTDGGRDTVTLSNGDQSHEDGTDTVTLSGGDQYHEDGQDEVNESGGDHVNYKNNTHDKTNFNGDVNSDFTGNKSENEHIRTLNFDYMKTYQQILEILTNIDTCIINDLRELFLYVY